MRSVIIRLLAFIGGTAVLVYAVMQNIEHVGGMQSPRAGLPVAKQTIWQRVSHSKAADQGKTAGEIDEDAAEDIEKLWDEIRRLVLAEGNNGD